ncbi:protein of unknown function (plasmid) [Cupriavidus taiwanensis]|uniref:Uncharacterized protein n=1 Tax=Cupriavidus taiwanensis TaxID=164546 RepID=A0A375I973_9BURK|nr:hypothetical protein CT19425_U370003 [Cupriavidus taiwanensis]SPK70640.1 hypothetical protein CT19425_U620002 [Cupriavidus taiwanensis]SPK77741.1 protein of unknown function [Cupriavidus taiwanensis]
MPEEVGNPSIFSATLSEARVIYGDFAVGPLGAQPQTVQSLRRTRVRAPHYMVSIRTLWPRSTARGTPLQQQES